MNSCMCSVVGLPIPACVRRHARPAARDDRRLLANVVGAQFDDRSYVNQATRAWPGAFVYLYFIIGCHPFSPANHLLSCLKITDRPFRYASPHLWNQLPDSFRQPHQSCLDSPPHPLSPGAHWGLISNSRPKGLRCARHRVWSRVLGMGILKFRKWAVSQGPPLKVSPK